MTSANADTGSASVGSLSLPLYLQAVMGVDLVLGRSTETKACSRSDRCHALTAFGAFLRLLVLDVCAAGMPSSTHV